MNYIKVSNIDEYLTNNKIGRYCFKGVDWGGNVINYKINMPSYSLEIKSYNSLAVLVVSFYNNLPTFIINVNDKCSSFTIQQVKECISIAYVYDNDDDKKRILQLSENSEIVYNQGYDISKYDETLMRIFLNKMDECGSEYDLPNAEDIVNFLGEYKELVNPIFIEKILEVANETDKLNWYKILNYFVARTHKMYLPSIII